MKNKLQYIIIFILIISNIFLAYKVVNKKKHPKDNEFKSELSYLKNRLGFDKNQLLEAKKEYKRYSKEKRSKERRFRRLDLTVINDLSENIDTNNINKDKYYEVAVALNKAKMEHWINIRKISNKEQVKKLTHKIAEHDSTTRSVMLDMITELEAKLFTLGLDEDQEEQLMSLAYRASEKLDKIKGGVEELEGELGAVLEGLYEVLNKSK